MNNNKIKIVGKSVSCSNTSRGVLNISFDDVDFDLTEYILVSVNCYNVSSTNFYIHFANLNAGTKNITLVYTSNASTTAKITFMFVKKQ